MYDLFGIRPGCIGCKTLANIGQRKVQSIELKLVYQRMDNERLLKKVTNAKVDRRSARGRPRFGWMDGVKRALNDRRIDVREASERARDRNEWRMIVTQF